MVATVMMVADPVHWIRHIIACIFLTAGQVV